MIEAIKKIDSHSHFGASYLGPEGNISGYTQDARRLGVVACVASPGPTPEIHRESGIYRPCIWIHNGETIDYVEQLCDSKGNPILERPAKINPYREVNEAFINSQERKNCGLSIFVMPIHHPILDTKDEVEKLLKHKETVALKIHGVSTFTGPRDIKPEVIDLIKRVGKPVVAHTDAYNGLINHPIQQAYRLSDPVEWVLWSQDTQIPVLLTHGTKLSREAINLVARTDNVLIGIAPDLLIQSERERLAIETDNYLDALFSMVSPDRLVFDIDYGWNISNKDNWNSNEWKMTTRLNLLAIRMGLSTQDLEDIYFNNSVRFFSI